MPDVISLAAIRRDRHLPPAVVQGSRLEHAGWLQGRVVRHESEGWQGVCIGRDRTGRYVVSVQARGNVAAWEGDLTYPEPDGGSAA